MDILNAIAGAAAGAVITFVATGWAKRRTERARALVALGTELALNLDAATKVLEKNCSYLPHPFNKKQWWEILDFPQSAWDAVLNSGSLSRLTPVTVEAVSRAYILLRRADYSARKLQVGQFDPCEATQYTLRVYDAGEAISGALAQIDSQKQYRKEMLKVGHPSATTRTWDTGSRDWRTAVAEAREGR